MNFNPLHKAAYTTKSDLKSALGVDYRYRCWHQDSFTLYFVYGPTSEP